MCVCDVATVDTLEILKKFPELLPKPGARDVCGYFSGNNGAFQGNTCRPEEECWPNFEFSDMRYENNTFENYDYNQYHVVNGDNNEDFCNEEDLVQRDVIDQSNNQAHAAKVATLQLICINLPVHLHVTQFEQTLACCIKTLPHYTWVIPNTTDPTVNAYAQGVVAHFAQLMYYLNLNIRVNGYWNYVAPPCESLGGTCEVECLGENLTYLYSGQCFDKDVCCQTKDQASRQLPALVTEASRLLFGDYSLDQQPDLNERMPNLSQMNKDDNLNSGDRGIRALCSEWGGTCASDGICAIGEALNLFNSNSAGNQVGNPDCPPRSCCASPNELWASGSLVVDLPTEGTAYNPNYLTFKMAQVFTGALTNFTVLYDQRNRSPSYPPKPTPINNGRPQRRQQLVSVAVVLAAVAATWDSMLASCVCCLLCRPAAVQDNKGKLVVLTRRLMVAMMHRIRCVPVPSKYGLVSLFTAATTAATAAIASCYHYQNA
eukprot:8117-Heterococcus_DN1.PRE.4